MQYKQKHAVVERNKPAEKISVKNTHEKMRTIGTIKEGSKRDNTGKNWDHDDTGKKINQLQRENDIGTRQNYKSTGNVDANEAATSKSTTSDFSGCNSTGGVVFICEIPSDSDGDDEGGVDHSIEELEIDDNCGERNVEGGESKKKRGVRKKKGRHNVNARDSVAIASPCTSEFVFLCDIPSDDSNDDNNHKIDHRNHSHTHNRLEDNTRQRGRENSGRRKDAVARNISGRKTDDLTSRSDDIINATHSTQGNVRSRDQCRVGPNPPVGTGSMPTPWSTRAQTMNKNRIDNVTTNQQSRQNNRPASHSNMHSTDFCTAKVWKSPVRHDASTQNNSTSSDSAVAAAEPVQLEPTVLKGRWADEDSNSDDE